MRSLICAASLLGFLAVIAWTSHPASAQDDDEMPTIKQIMAKLHKGAKAPLKTVQTQLKGDSPDWSKVETEAKIIEKFGAFLPKAEPPKGEKASYEKLAKAYEKNAKALKEAAEKEDLTKARDATKGLGKSCAGLPQGPPADLSGEMKAPCRVGIAGAHPDMSRSGHLARSHRDAAITMQFPMISHKAARFTESVIRGMSIEARRARRGEPGAGHAGLPGPGGGQGGGLPRDRGRHQSVRDHLGCARPAPGDRRACRLAPGPAGGSRDRDHRHLRQHRGDAGAAACR